MDIRRPGTVIVLSVLAVGFIAAGCGVEPSADPDASAPDVERSAPSSSTTSTAPAPTTSAPVDSEEPAGDALEVTCSRLISTGLIDIPRLQDDGLEPASREEFEAEAAEIEQGLPERFTAAWDEYLDLAERSYDDPSSITSEDYEHVVSLMDEIATWGAATCADVGPVWSCLYRSSFTTVGESIGSDEEWSDESADLGELDPLDLVAGLTDGEGSIELIVTDQARLYGWLDEEGDVVRTYEVTRSGDRWVKGPDTSCSDSGTGSAEDDEFYDIGEEITD